jgi:RecA-family ATPase
MNKDRPSGVLNEARLMRNAARGYWRRGLQPVPIPYGKKQPRLPAWQHLEINEDSLDEHWSSVSQANVGLMQGPKSGGLTDVDVDCKRTLKLGSRLLPRTDAIYGRPGKPRSHYLYFTRLGEGSQSVRKYAEHITDKDKYADRIKKGLVIVELRSGGTREDGSNIGAVSLAPPSWREDVGERLRWDEDGEPARVKDDFLVLCVEQLGVAGLMLRNYPGDGSRNEAALAIGGLLARHTNWPEGHIRELVEAAAVEAGDEEWKQRGEAAASAIGRFEKREPVAGLPRVRDVWGDIVADTLSRWLGFADNEASSRPMRTSQRNEEIQIVPFSDVEMASAHWLWEGRLARGKMTILSGETGSGKTHVALDIAAHITTKDEEGCRWPDGSGKAPLGSVIILSAEDAVGDTLRPRLEAMGGSSDRVYNVRAVVSPQNDRRLINLKTDLALLERRVREIDDVVCVIIDPITSYLGDRDGNSFTLVRSVIDAVSDFAERLDVAVLAITHPPKSSAAARALMAFIGSQAFLAAARLAFLFVLDPEDDNPLEENRRRLMLPVKNNLGPKASGMAYYIREHWINGVRASRIEWDKQPVRLTADEALKLARRDPGERTAARKLEFAEDFLREQLAGGPKAAEKLLAAAKKLDIGERTLREAKRELGIKSFTQGFQGQSYWKMPDAEGPNRPMN